MIRKLFEVLVPTYPYKELQKILSRISNNLTLFASVYPFPPQKIQNGERLSHKLHNAHYLRQ